MGKYTGKDTSLFWIDALYNSLYSGLLPFQ